MKSFFTPKNLCDGLAVSYRMIQYWDKTGLLRPAYRRRGKYRLYTCADVCLMWCLVSLRRETVSIQRIRRILPKVKELLPRVNWPLRDTIILFDRFSGVLMFDAVVLVSDARCYTRVAFEDILGRLSPIESDASELDLSRIGATV